MAAGRVGPIGALQNQPLIRNDQPDPESETIFAAYPALLKDLDAELRAGASGISSAISSMLLLAIASGIRAGNRLGSRLPRLDPLHVL